MISKLKDVKVILIIALVLTWVLAGAGGYFFYKSKESAIGKKNEEIANLENTLAQIGELVTVFQVATDVPTGKKIDESDLVPVDVPLATATNLVQDSAELIGKYFKTSLKTGTSISSDMVYAEELTDDMRYLDAVLHNIPVGLKSGSYVDVRITLPSGQDFISMGRKRVADINNGVLKLVVTEKDILTYNSMLIDSYLYTGTQLYALEYIEGGIQAQADTFYPISSSVLAIAQKNPNLLEAIKSDIIIQRENLEGTITTSKIKQDDVNLTLERNRDKFRATVVDAEREFQRRMERQAEEEKYANE